MKILVTGASGFIGQNLVGRLLADGHAVRAIYRRALVPPALERAAMAFPGRLELIRQNLDFPASMPDLGQADIREWCRSAKSGIPSVVPWYPAAPGDLAQARALCEGMDGVFHVAARVGDWGSLHEFFAANVNPTRILLEAARAAKVRRFVHCSSISVHGFGHNRQSREDDPFFFADNPYQTSKRLAESLTRTAIGQGLDARVVRPGNVYGPGDTTTFYPIFDAMLQGLNGTLGGGRTLTCPVFITDLLDGFMGALLVENPEARTFNLTSGETVSWKELYAAASDALGVSRGWINIPAWLAWILAVVGEGAFKLVRSATRPPFTRYLVGQVLHDYQFSTETASRVLGYQPRVMAQEGLRLTAEAYRAERGLTATKG